MTADDSYGRLDDDDYPAYTMGRAAEMIGTTQSFLRAIGEARLITPLRSEGGHRRYSRYQLRIAARARELVDQGTPIEAACRIIILEDQLEEAQRINAEHRRTAETRIPDDRRLSRWNSRISRQPCDASGTVPGTLPASRARAWSASPPAAPYRLVEDNPGFTND